jgi:Dolichyl-phosphate-mannose-protein mannosyltransferase
MNSDEATAGLVAQQIAHGHLYAFYWGQSYGGVETYVLAGNFLVFGHSPFVLNATPTLLALVGSLIVWRIGLRLFQPNAAMVAAVLSWIWSESSLWNSTREYGLHEVAMVLSLTLLLESLRIAQKARDQQSDRLIDWALLGAAGGLGFWASPEIVYVAIPAFLMVALSLRYHTVLGAAQRAGLALVTTFVGMLPWIRATATRSASAHPLSQETYSPRLGTFFSHVLPMVLGLRVEGVGRWEGGQVFGVTVSVFVVLLVVCCAVRLVSDRPDAWILALILALFPFLYAAFPTSWFWNDGRYGLSLTPILALVIAGGIWQMVRPTLAMWLASALLLLACASTLVAFNDGYGAIGTPSKLTSLTANPNTDVTALAAQLDHLGITHAYAGYSVANLLTFISNDRVTALAFHEERNPPGATNVGAKRVAWIFVANASLRLVAAQLGTTSFVDPGTLTETQLTSWLTAHMVPYQRHVIGGFDVIVPKRAVSPAAVTG